MTKILWTQKEDEVLKKYYPLADWINLQSYLPNRSLFAIKRRAKSHLKLKILDPKKSVRKGNVQPLLDNSLESFYWLGFLMADGNFRRNQIRLKINKKDKIHLIKYANFLEAEIHENSPSLICSNAVSMEIKDKKRVASLIEKYKISPRKTYEPPDLSSINDKNNFWAFFAGFVDGDGCIRTIRTNKHGDMPDLKISCHKSWLPIFKQFFQFNIEKYLKITIPDPIISNNMSVLHISKLEVLQDIKKIILRLNLPVLERKWNNINLSIVPQEKRVRKIKNAIEKDLSMQKICRECNCCESTVRKYKK